MQEEVNQKTIAFSIKTAKLTASVLKKALAMYLNHLKNKKENTHGLRKEQLFQNVIGRMSRMN